MRLSSPITEVPGVGPAKAKALARLGITHVRDILYTFPRRYEDFSRITPIAALKAGQPVSIHGRVKSCRSDWGWRGRQRLLRIFVDIEDDTGVLKIVWYNLRFLSDQLKTGREIYIAGEVRENKKGELVMHSPAFEFVHPEPGRGAADHTHTARIVPIYPETAGVTSRWLRYRAKQLLPLITALPEYLPENIRTCQKLVNIQAAIQEVHFPSDTNQLKDAERRLRFDELFFLQLAALVRRRERQKKPAHVLKITAPQIKQAVARLPFTLTSAQGSALQEVVMDLKKNTPMNRLLQGDVGSGKSAIALLASQLVTNTGYQVMYLAPTEILAQQQYQSFQSFLGPAKVALLVGSLPRRQKEAVKNRLNSEESICVIGTHALVQKDVTAGRLGLVIIDEQHRFGVAQRAQLFAPRMRGSHTPHLLSMTATPIPRTLNLTVYGDLDISVLNELPPGRQPVTTKIAAGQAKEPAIIHILEELHQGRQAFCIAPLIEQSEKIEAKSAVATYKEMQQLFPGIAIGLLHGQLSSEEKDGVMMSFTAGAIQLLVATAVVEVGVNVPNATIMIIEGAERFGLAQLHQFRGRVGRGEYQSHCYLFPTSEAAASNPRLKILTQTNDGFKIAEEDLKLRGPGEVYGLAQSGFGDLKVASLLDYATIKAARSEAGKLLKADPDLVKYPILKAKVAQKNLHTHFE